MPGSVPSKRDVATTMWAIEVLTVSSWFQIWLLVESLTALKIPAQPATVA